MSSVRRVRIPPTENLRFPEEGSSSQGKSGPKVKPKGDIDGKPVNIPVLLNTAKWGRSDERSAY